MRKDGLLEEHAHLEESLLLVEVIFTKDSAQVLPLGFKVECQRLVGHEVAKIHSQRLGLSNDP